VSTPDRLVVLGSLAGGTGTYVWSTTDGSSWTQSSAVIPGTSPYGFDVTFANGALWVTGETDIALYQSTDWGDSWAPVSTNLPELDSLVGVDLMNLGTSPGLILSFGINMTSGSSTYISENGSEWTKVADEDFDGVTISDSGQIWLYEGGDSYTNVPSELYTIGGPLRNGRFFYYQKD